MKNKSMKKLSVLMAMVFSLGFVSVAHAQVKLGVKAGMNFSNLKLGDNNYNANNKAGYFFGPMVKATIPLIGLSFDVAALYDRKEAEMTWSETEVGGTLDETARIKQQYIDIPVNVRYGVGLGSIANVFVFAGPQWGINVGDDEFKWNSVSSYSLKKATFSVNVGAGVTLLKHLQGSVNYNIECNKSGEMQYEGNYNKSWKGRNNTWQVSLGYWF